MQNGADGIGRLTGGYMRPTGGAAPGNPRRDAGGPRMARESAGFGAILEGKLSEVRFSKHAEARLSERKMGLSEEMRERLNGALQKAERKGIRESLVIMDDMAFVLSVRSRTVITAVVSGDLGESVFTNIDGAVIA